MAILASVEKVRGSLGFDDMADINAALLSALNSATPHIASKMNMSSFDRQTVTDLFIVPNISYQSGGAYFTQFRLSHGLLTDTPIVTRRATTYADVATAAPMGDIWQINRTKGILTDLTTLYDRDVVSVVYECGLESTTEAGITTYDDVPEWLSEAAMLQALILMQNNPLIKDSNVVINGKELRYSLDIMMANHIRYAPSAISPM